MTTDEIGTLATQPSCPNPDCEWTENKTSRKLSSQSLPDYTRVLADTTVYTGSEADKLTASPPE